MTIWSTARNRAFLGLVMLSAVACDSSTDPDEDVADVAHDADTTAEDAADGPDVVADTPDEDDGADVDEADDGATDVPAPPTDSCYGPAGAAVAEASVPEGFCAWVWAGGLSSPRGLETVPGGDVLVVERGRASVVVLFDDDGDGVAGAAERVTLAAAPGLNHGLAVHDGFLYASSSTTVFRWPYVPGERTARGEPEVVVRDIPGGGHATRTLAFDGAGRLYVSIGSAGNVDADASRAGIRRLALDAVPAGGLPFADGEWFAIGLRNEVGLAFDAAGRLWGVENGVDNLARADLGGDIHNDNPAEELNRFDESGLVYGYPYCWSEILLPAGVGGGPTTQWAHPSFLGDGVHDDSWCTNTANVVPPRLALPAHTAPLGIVFYDGPSFPAAMRGDAFVALHGSWNRDEPIGYKVVRIPFAGGPEPLGFESFFEYGGPGDLATAWPHRPVDLRVGRRGELLVTSDASGAVIAIGHRPAP
jgi:glucose/arabinose dehydrogenase